MLIFWKFSYYLMAIFSAFIFFKIFSGIAGIIEFIIVFGLTVYCGKKSGKQIFGAKF